MPLGLDDTDRHLLSLLQAYAREPAAMLARKLRVARTTVVARIARLEREGVIAGYGVRLGQRLEQAAVQAYCGLSTAPKMGTGIVRALERLPEVEEISAVSGQFDYMDSSRRHGCSARRPAKPVPGSRNPAQAATEDPGH